MPARLIEAEFHVRFEHRELYSLERAARICVIISTQYLPSSIMRLTPSTCPETRFSLPKCSLCEGCIVC